MMNDKQQMSIDEIPIDALNTIMRAMLKLVVSEDVKFSFLLDDGLVVVFQVGRRRASFFLKEEAILLKTTNEQLETRNDVIYIGEVDRIVETIEWVQGSER